MVASKEATIRYNGRQYHDDRTISASQKKAMQRVLDAYEARGVRCEVGEGTSHRRSTMSIHD